MRTTQNYGLKKPEGTDVVNIDDLNMNADIIDRELGRMDNKAVVTLTAAGWSASAPYSQKVAVPGIKESDNPEVHLYIPKDLDAATVKLRQKLTGMITDGETENGYVTLYCGAKKPTADFAVLLKGVSMNG